MFAFLAGYKSTGCAISSANSDRIDSIWLFDLAAALEARFEYH